MNPWSVSYIRHNETSAAMNLCCYHLWKVFRLTHLAMATGGLLCTGDQPKPTAPVNLFSVIHEVPLFPTAKLAPLDYRTLSQGKITHYILGAADPNDSCQEAMLEACRELPIKNATARSAAMVLYSTTYGHLPIRALVVNNTTVLIEVSGVVRALRLILSPGMPEVLYERPSITLTPKSKWAFVGKKRVPLHMAYYWAHNGYRVMDLRDLVTLFHERDRQTGGKPDVLSTEVSYEPMVSKLYSPP